MGQGLRALRLLAALFPNSRDSCAVAAMGVSGARRFGQAAERRAEFRNARQPLFSVRFQLVGVCVLCVARSLLRDARAVLRTAAALARPGSARKGEARCVRRAQLNRARSARDRTLCRTQSLVARATCHACISPVQRTRALPPPVPYDHLPQVGRGMAARRAFVASRRTCGPRQVPPELRLPPLSLFLSTPEPLNL